MKTPAVADVWALSALRPQGLEFEKRDLASLACVGAAQCGADMFEPVKLQDWLHGINFGNPHKSSRSGAELCECVMLAQMSRGELGRRSYI